MDTQSTYTLAFFDADLNPAFAGANLTVKLSISNTELTCVGGVLTGPAFGIIVLSSQNFESTWWLTGADDGNTIGGSDIVPTAQPLGLVPRLLVGSMEINSVNYYVMGICQGEDAPDVSTVAKRKERPAGSVAAATAGSSSSDPEYSYDSELFFYDMSFQPTSERAHLTGTGHMVAIGPASKEFQVRGNLTIGAASAPFIGWGSTAYWSASSTSNDGAFSFMAATGLLTPGKNPIGTITSRGTMSFFIGQPGA